MIASKYILLLCNIRMQILYLMIKSACKILANTQKFESQPVALKIATCVVKK